MNRWIDDDDDGDGDGDGDDDDDDDQDDDDDDQVTIRPIIMLGSILTDFAMTCASPAFTSWNNDEHRAPTSYHRYLYSRVADAIYN